MNDVSLEYVTALKKDVTFAAVCEIYNWDVNKFSL